MAVSEKRLCDLTIGEKGRVKRISGEPTLRRRVREMGLIMCADVEVDKIAPFGDPMGIVVQDYHLSLRRKEAENILIELEAENEIGGY
jgi:Fe2+ transport system protein FeoA